MTSCCGGGGALWELHICSAQVPLSHQTGEEARGANMQLTTLLSHGQRDDIDGCGSLQG